MRLKPYRCTAGNLTIGVGPNLDECRSSQKEAYALLYIDIRNCEQHPLDEIPAICSALDEIRQSAFRSFSG